MISTVERSVESARDFQQDNVRSIMNAGELLLASSQLEIGGKYQESFLSSGAPHQLDVNIGHLPHTVDHPLLLFNALLELWTDENVSASERVIVFHEVSPGEVFIRSKMVTEPGYESRGYGEGLFRFGHRLVYDLLDLDLLRNKSVIWEAIDTARSLHPGKTRKGWTSRLALDMGYEPCGINEFLLPVFRFRFQ